MSNKSTIKCPNCTTEFEATDAFRNEVQRELNLKAKEWQAKKEEEYRIQMNEALKNQKENIEEQMADLPTNFLKIPQQWLFVNSNLFSFLLRDRGLATQNLAISPPLSALTQASSLRRVFRW